VSALLAAPQGMERRDVHWVYLSTVYFLLAGAVFYLYLAHVLPPSELGAVVILQAIGTVVSTAVALGLGSGFQHFLSYYRGRQDSGVIRVLLRGSIAASALLAVVGFTLTFALSGELGSLLFRSSAYESTLELLSLYAGLATAMTILQGVVLGLQRFVLYSMRSVVTYTITYGAAVLFLSFRPGVSSIVAGWILGTAVGCALYLGAMLKGATILGTPTEREPAPRFAAQPLYRSVVLYSVPVFVSSVITTSSTYVDRLVLASISNLASVGFYNFALLFVTGSLVLTVPFLTILVPRLSEHLGRDERGTIRAITRTCITLIALVYVPFALIVAALGPFLLRYLVGASFVQDSLPMAVLLALTAAAIPVTILRSLAAGIRRTPSLMRASAAALVANIALSLVLIPRIGVLGAALGNSAMYWAPLFVLSLELRGSGFVDVDLRSLARIWLAAGAMTVAIASPLLEWGYRPILVLGSLALGCIVLVVGLRLFRAIPADAAEMLVDLVPRRMGFLVPAICWVSACDHCHHGKGVRGVTTSAGRELRLSTEPVRQSWPNGPLQVPSQTSGPSRQRAVPADGSPATVEEVR